MSAHDYSCACSCHWTDKFVPPCDECPCDIETVDLGGGMVVSLREVMDDG